MIVFNRNYLLKPYLMSKYCHTEVRNSIYEFGGGYSSVHSILQKTVFEICGFNYNHQGGGQCLWPYGFSIRKAGVALASGRIFQFHWKKSLFQLQNKLSSWPSWRLNRITFILLQYHSKARRDSFKLEHLAASWEVCLTFQTIYIVSFN